MTFPQPEPQAPTTIRGVIVTLADQVVVEAEIEDVNEAYQAATYRLDVRDQNGRPIQYPFNAGDIVPHMNPEWQAAAQALIAEARAVAEAGILVSK